MDYIQFLYQSLQGELDMKPLLNSGLLNALTEGGMPIRPHGGIERRRCSRILLLPLLRDRRQGL